MNDFTPPGDKFLTLSGDNEPGPHVIPLSTLPTTSNSQQDNYFAFPITRPTPFHELGWLGDLVAAPDEWSAQDELFAYWPNIAGFNRAADGYFYPVENLGWFDGSNPFEALPATYLIPAHTVFFIRKAPTPGGTTSFLTVNPSN